MQITETLYVASREAWREWLATNHASAPEIWLISYRKATGRPSIRYNDAVEEALCFGWIDSTRKGLDEHRYAQRFSPRQPTSTYSQPNRERLARMVAQGRVMPHVLSGLADLQLDQFEYPEDILAALQGDARAWTHFQTYSEPYRRIRVAFVETARERPEEFQKRLAHLVRMTEQGKQFGHGIEDYY